MKGGVILFRGSGAAARRYVEADRSRADEYYLGADDAVAEYTVLDASGEVTAARSLTADEYEGWVDWINPITGVLLQSWGESSEDSVSHFLMAAACGRSQAVSKTRLTITASGFGCPYPIFTSIDTLLVNGRVLRLGVSLSRHNTGAATFRDASALETVCCRRPSSQRHYSFCCAVPYWLPSPQTCWSAWSYEPFSPLESISPRGKYSATTRRCMGSDSSQDLPVGHLVAARRPSLYLVPPCGTGTFKIAYFTRRVMSLR